MTSDSSDYLSPDPRAVQRSASLALVTSTALLTALLVFAGGEAQLLGGWRLLAVPLLVLAGVMVGSVRTIVRTAQR